VHTSHEGNFTHNNTVSNTENKKRTLKEKKELWITPVEGDRLWILVVWMISKTEVRQALLETAVENLPVISY
jgi:hypothetical protein